MRDLVLIHAWQWRKGLFQLLIVFLQRYFLCYFPLWCSSKLLPPSRMRINSSQVRKVTPWFTCFYWAALGGHLTSVCTSISLSLPVPVSWGDVCIINDSKVIWEHSTEIPGKCTERLILRTMWQGHIELKGTGPTMVSNFSINSFASLSPLLPSQILHSRLHRRWERNQLGYRDPWKEWSRTVPGITGSVANSDYANLRCKLAQPSPPLDICISHSSRSPRKCGI